MDSQGHYIDRTNETEAQDIRELQAKWRQNLRDHHPRLEFNENAVNGIFAFSQLLAVAWFDCCALHSLQARNHDMEYVREHRFTQLANVCAGDPEVGRWNQCMLSPLVDSAKQVAQKV